MCSSDLRLTRPPRIFHVNWFRRDAQGKFLWPGFGDNLRVLAWMLQRYTGNVGASDSAIGRLPRSEDLNIQGLNVSADALRALLTVDPTLWRKEVADVRSYLEQFGSRLPGQLLQQLNATEAGLR